MKNGTDKKTLNRFLSAYFLVPLAVSLISCQKNKDLITEADSFESSTGENIVAGSNVSENDPLTQSTVAILIESPQGQGLCTGTLIAKNTVLTAGHCFSPDATRAAVIFGNDIDKSQTIFPVDQVIIHPAYGSRAIGKGGWNDLSVIRFVGDAPAKSRAIDLLPDSKILKKGQTGIAAGFGNTDPKGVASDEGKLRKVQLTLLNPNYEGSELLFPLGNKGGSTCHGDSGGPIYMNFKGKLVLIGVTSRGTGADCKNVSIFTNVAAHLDFIRQSVKNLSLSAMQNPQL